MLLPLGRMMMDNKLVDNIEGNILLVMFEALCLFRPLANIE